MKKEFQSRLEARGPGGAWVFLPIPFDVEQAFGSKARVAVAGALNGYPFRNCLLPQGDGTDAMAVNKALQAGAGAAAGDVVAVSMAVDREQRQVPVPEELQRALAGNRKAAAAFEALSSSHKREYAEWIGGAKKAETRLNRAAKAPAMILEKQHVR